MNVGRAPFVTGFCVAKKTNVFGWGFPGILYVDGYDKYFPDFWLPNYVIDSQPRSLIQPELLNRCVQRFFRLLAIQPRFLYGLLCGSCSGDHLSPLKYSYASINGSSAEGEPSPNRQPLLKAILALAVFASLSFYCFWNLQFGSHDWRLLLLLLMLCFFGIMYGTYELLDAAAHRAQLREEFVANRYEPLSDDVHDLVHRVSFRTNDQTVFLVHEAERSGAPGRTVKDVSVCNFPKHIHYGNYRAMFGNIGKRVHRLKLQYRPAEKPPIKFESHTGCQREPLVDELFSRGIECWHFRD